MDRLRIVEMCLKICSPLLSAHQSLLTEPSYGELRHCDINMFQSVFSRASRFANARSARRLLKMSKPERFCIFSRFRSNCARRLELQHPSLMVFLVAVPAALFPLVSAEGEEDKALTSRLTKHLVEARKNIRKSLKLPPTQDLPDVFKFQVYPPSDAGAMKSFHISFSVPANSILQSLAYLTKSFTEFHSSQNDEGDLSVFSMVAASGTSSFTLTHDPNNRFAKIHFFSADTPSDVQLQLLSRTYEMAWIKNMPLEIQTEAGRDSLRNEAMKTLTSLGCTIYSKSSEAEKLDWSCLAGYDNAKQDVDDTILMALKHPECYDDIAHKTRVKFESNRPKAVLFCGPPGTGKTTTARIIASQVDIPLVYVPIESVMSKWYGESEGKLAQIFDACEGLGDAIIFIDEVDSLATSRDTSMHEATRRLLSVLLRRLDGFEQDKQRVLTVCATNRKEDLDAALISRFDLTVKFELPSESERLQIFRRYAKHLSGNEIRNLAKLSETFSGRDIKEVCLHAERKYACQKLRGKAKEAQTPGADLYKLAIDARNV